MVQFGSSALDLVTRAFIGGHLHPVKFAFSERVNFDTDLGRFKFFVQLFWAGLVCLCIDYCQRGHGLNLSVPCLITLAHHVVLRKVVDRLNLRALGVQMGLLYMHFMCFVCLFLFD